METETPVNLVQNRTVGVRQGVSFVKCRIKVVWLTLEDTLEDSLPNRGLPREKEFLPVEDEGALGVSPLRDEPARGARHIEDRDGEGKEHREGGR